MVKMIYVVIKWFDAGFSVNVKAFTNKEEAEKFAESCNKKFKELGRREIWFEVDSVDLVEEL